MPLRPKSGNFCIGTGLSRYNLQIGWRGWGAIRSGSMKCLRSRRHIGRVAIRCLFRIIKKIEPQPDDPSVKLRIDQRLLDRHFSELTSKYTQRRLGASVLAE